MDVGQRAAGSTDGPSALVSRREATIQLDHGHRLSQRGRFAEAETALRSAISLDPELAIAHNNLGWVRQMQGDNDAAVASYRKALALDPSLRIARRNLATLLLQLGRRDESLPVWHAELLSGEESVSWLMGLATAAMHLPDLTLAGEYASLLSELRWASPWYPPRERYHDLPLPVRAPEVFLTVSKLRHDIEQFEYLQRRGILGEELGELIDAYRAIIDRIGPDSPDRRLPLEPEDLESIGHIYNRIAYIRPTPRVERVFSGAWDPEEIERQYLEKPVGFIVIDDFLSDEALGSLRDFALESTVWSGNRYAHGRLGAFFFDGFNCPLLTQIAEELRRSMPRIILDQYPLRQLWGFKNDTYLPADSTVHADFAAVNVNFWITPEEANADPDSGGLVVYDVDAPLAWDFAAYNGRPDLIMAFLEQQQARRVYIPYRQNRAIVFDSDLFHSSAGLTFHPGYENRRINITMLYGDREQDIHNPETVELKHAAAPGRLAPAWRSAAFRRGRAEGPRRQSGT